MEKVSIIRLVVSGIPNVRPLLSPRARFMIADPAPYKTYDYFLQQVIGLVRGVYSNNLNGDFIDIMANLISGQLTQAFRQAFEDEGHTDFILPDYLQTALTEMIANQYLFVDQYFRDIIDARLDGTSIDPLLARAEMWAGQWDTAYREATRLIQMEGGGNFVWRKGETEHGCQTCENLDGIVASAREWQQLDVHPRGYPNSKLQCEGGGPANNCDCELLPTDQRRSPGAYGRIEEAIL